MRVRPDLRVRLERGGLVGGVSALGLALLIGATGGPAYDVGARAAALPARGPATVSPAAAPTLPVPTAVVARADDATAAPVVARDAGTGVGRGRSDRRGGPVRVVVPRLEVDAPVVPVTVQRGVLLPPADPLTLGWWRGGAAPGQARGSTLITGHTVSTGGGALDDLETLSRGDRVRVHTERGAIRYVVGEVRIYRKARLARHAARVFSQSVTERLVLVTCEDWDGSSYRSNVVVVAHPLGHR